MAWVCRGSLSPAKKIARAFCLALLAYETLAAFNYFQCQILFTWDAPRGTTSACSRLFGDGRHYIEASLMAPVMAWLLYTVFFRTKAR